ncbi:conserved hypothetical protein [Desulforapulum autotrophicum HRM2]|uniref:Magnesium transporter MgtE intracellular domain-containing protein n=1 Tax=Desulforapulum autotrophicum (strain ATCC 43914 / DSM 3382 / VKM B-1955 / HRM2) TaxID=177437 RepID=C0QAJ9_DESAH|nr:hypothetical protein [Desulforapulum autotrophicum]ACN16782.1 conserved hypothetical protein [Desulforapulum autotrophicum HRM2]
MAPINLNRTAVTCALLALVLLIFLGMGWQDRHGMAFAADDNAEKTTAVENGAGEDIKKAPCPPCPDPAKVVLKGLEEKRAAIAEDQERLEQEKKRLEKFKEEIDEKLEALGTLKQQIQDDLAKLDQRKTEQELESQAAFDAKMNTLVKVYSGMKPKKAAAIVDKMDIEVAKQIFSRMRETSAAQILAFVDSEKAAKISERIAFKKK